MEKEPKKIPGIEALFRTSWESYKARATTLAKISLLFIVAGVVSIIAGIIVLVIGLVFSALGGGVAGGDLGSGFIGSLPLIIPFAFIIGFVVMSVLSVYVTNMLYLSAIEKPGMTLSELFKKVKPLFIPATIVTFLSSLVIMGGYLAIVPGIFFSIALMFCMHVILTEDLRGLAVLRRSRELIRGQWWAVLGRMIIVVLAWIVVSGGVQFLLIQIKLELLSSAWSLVDLFIITPFIIVYTTEIWRQLVVLNGTKKAESVEDWKIIVPLVAGIIALVLVVVAIIAMVSWGISSFGNILNEGKDIDLLNYDNFDGNDSFF